MIKINILNVILLIALTRWVLSMSFDGLIVAIIFLIIMGFAVDWGK